jgi:hypothetical protein
MALEPRIGHSRAGWYSLPVHERRIRLDFGINESASSLEALVERIFGPGGSKGGPAVLDLSRCSYLGPLGASVLAGLALSSEPGRFELAPPTHSKSLAFCEFSGLLERFKVGPAPAPHPKNVTTPIRSFGKERPQSAYDEIAELVHRVMSLPAPAETQLRTSLAELADNVLYHSKSLFGGLTVARAFENEREVRFVVLDAGVGIRRSLAGPRRLLQARRGITSRDDVDAIQQAMKEGVSARSSDRNLGQGLPLLYDIVQRNGGSLVLASRRGLVALENGRFTTRHLRYEYPGTIAMVRLKIREGEHEEEEVANVWGG